MSGGRSGRARVCVDAHTPRGSTRGRVGKHARPSACASRGPLRVGWTREQTARNAPADAQPRRARVVPAKRLTESGRLPDVPQTCPRRALSLPPPARWRNARRRPTGTRHRVRRRGESAARRATGRTKASPVRATGGASPGPLARRAHGACAPRDEPCSLCIRGYASTASGGGPRGHEGLASNTRWRAVGTHHRPLLAFHHMWTTRRQRPRGVHHFWSSLRRPGFLFHTRVAHATLTLVLTSFNGAVPHWPGAGQRAGHNAQGPGRHQALREGAQPLLFCDSCSPHTHARQVYLEAYTSVLGVDKAKLVRTLLAAFDDCCCANTDSFCATRATQRMQIR